MPLRSPLRLVALLALALCSARSAGAQYFGRNKVQYEKFDWRILKSDHFDLYFYPAESLKVDDAGRQAERWYTRLSDIFRHQFDRKSVVFYADHPAHGLRVRDAEVIPLAFSDHHAVWVDLGLNL